MCHKILKSCCLGLVEFIHKDYNTLNHRSHKPNTGNRYFYDFLALFKMIFLLKCCVTNPLNISFIHYPFLFSFVVEECVIYF